MQGVKCGCATFGRRLVVCEAPGPKRRMRIHRQGITTHTCSAMGRRRELTWAQIVLLSPGASSLR